MFVDEWGRHTEVQLAVTGAVIAAMGLVFLAFGAGGIVAFPPDAGFYRASSTVGGILLVLMAAGWISFAALRRRAPFMIARDGLYLPDRVDALGPARHGRFVPWGDIAELSVEEATERGLKTRFFYVTLVLRDGTRKWFSTVTHSDVKEVLKEHRPAGGESAEARI